MGDCVSEDKVKLMISVEVQPLKDIVNEMRGGFSTIKALGGLVAFVIVVLQFLTLSKVGH